MSIEGVTWFQSAVGDIALLVDGENVSPSYAATLLDIARALAPLRLARVYGRFSHLGDWHVAPGFNVVITPARPQAADIQIAIDAVAMAHGAGIPNFVLCSDDRDFSALAFHLRVAGCSVLGVGTSKASASLRAAFSRFEEIGSPAPPVLIAQGEATRVEPSRKGMAVAICKCFQESGTERKEVKLVDLAKELKLRGYQKLTKGWRKELVEDFSNLCDVLGEHPHLSVRLRQPAPATP